MDKGTKNSGIPVFGEVIKMLDKEEIMQIAVKLQADTYFPRWDTHKEKTRLSKLAYLLFRP
jgi:hypothetical protein